MKLYYKSCCLFLASTITNAGDMGAATNKDTTTPFIIGEGNVSWIAYQTDVINNVYSTQLNNIWGGRFGAGITRKYRGESSFTSEIGYGYYGRVRTSFPNNVNNNYYAIDGLDALVGFLYSIKDIDLFFKAGAMIENKRYKGILNYDRAYSGNVISGTYNYNSNLTQVLPELKTGGMYNINKNIAFSFSYMHVFGSSTNLITNTSASNSPTSIVFNGNNHNQNPAVDSFLFGVQYNLT